jgi:hypothetical protein
MLQPPTLSKQPLTLLGRRKLSDILCLSVSFPYTLKFLCIFTFLTSSFSQTKKSFLSLTKVNLFCALASVSVSLGPCSTNYPLYFCIFDLSFSINSLLSTRTCLSGTYSKKFFINYSLKLLSTPFLFEAKILRRACYIHYNHLYVHSLPPSTLLPSLN